MKSMTGFGKSRIAKDSVEVYVEIKSINGRFFDLKTYIPRELNFFEYEIRKMVSARLKRGTIELRLYIDDQREPNIAVNELKLRKHYEVMKKALDLLKIDQEIPLDILFANLDIFEIDYKADEDSILIELIQNAIKHAIDELENSLSEEGANIKKVFMDSIETIESAIEKVKQEIQPYKEELFETMKKRIEQITQDFKIDTLEQRLVQELALYIDRYDVHEEITRIESHIELFLETIENESEIGKNLNFILQEMQREANTLGSKFSNSNTFQNIIVIKEEIEKCREIAHNVS
ncbi:MAG TPA: YicC family protein [Candidatus Cloacimonetes bacterium]|nr:YicC family protein [Candidatus Cloacimonadota bacterium]